MTNINELNLSNSCSFKPLTKDDVGYILGICERTVETWIREGQISSPVSIGKRVYWHPAKFFQWLSERLLQDEAVTRATPLPGPSGAAAVAAKESARGRKASGSAARRIEKIKARALSAVSASA